MSETAITPTRAQNYPEWYQAVIKAADMAENSAVRGCMVIKPWGYGIWERMQAELDLRIKATGHVNAYFPLFIPLSFLEKEASHVEGFAKECAVVTHHRLMADPNNPGKLIPTSPLEEPLIVRPTSETIIGESYAKWVKSYRDLPILINQWANVVRWEMRTRLFLRTTEFLWQEGHTAHATKEEAVEETLKMLDVYEEFSRTQMALPVIKGEKTSDERFPGAVNTYSIEAMMQDGKALQAGTSHFLGQNFAKASGIKFQSKEEREEFAWTTSWGVTTRLIGALIMTHSDDNGLVLPPALAPDQIVILPIYKKDDEKTKVLDACSKLLQQLSSMRDSAGRPLRARIDNRDINAGTRSWEHIKKGVPIRVEMGPRDLDKGGLMAVDRLDESRKKEFFTTSDFLSKVTAKLETMQSTLLQRAEQKMQSRIHSFKNKDEMIEAFEKAEKSSVDSGFFAKVFVEDNPETLSVLKEHKLSARCMPLAEKDLCGDCILSGNKGKARVTIIAKAY